MARRSTRKRKATNPEIFKEEETNELDERMSVKKEEEQGDLRVLEKENGAVKMGLTLTMCHSSIDTVVNFV